MSDAAAPAWSIDDELDLRFYLCVAPSRAAGLRSNFGAQCEAMAMGFGFLNAQQCEDPDGPMVERLDDSERASFVRRCLVAIGTRHTSALVAAYCGEQLPTEVKLKWGDELGGVVMSIAKERKRTETRLAEDAQKRLDAAKLAFAEAAAAGRREARARQHRRQVERDEHRAERAARGELELFS